VVDSITHVWTRLCEDFLKRVNDSRARNRMQTLDRLEFQHWNTLKPMWNEWCDLLLNSPLHIIVCGRAGWNYSMDENEKGRKELSKVGIKLKAESEFTFEPNLVVEMSAEQVMERGEVASVTHRALVLKDRNPNGAQSLVGRSADNPGWEFFKPHLDYLTPGAHSFVDTSRETRIDVDEAGNGEWHREKRMREVLCEELAAELDKSSLSGQSAEAKKGRVRLLEECFGTASKTAIENMKSDHLRESLAKVRIRLSEMQEATNGA